MNYNVVKEINSNPNYIKYLRENSYWYKDLNRNPESLQRFIDEVKVKYQLRPTDKINNALKTIEILQNVVSTLK